MEKDELLELTATPAELVQKLKAIKPALKTEEALKQYKPETHKVMDLTYRKDKTILKPTGEKNADGSDKTEQDTVKVARIPVFLQGLIVDRAVNFLTGVPVELEAAAEGAAQETLLQMVEKTWQDNKLNFKTGPLAEAMMSEMECAELWYLEKGVNSSFWGKLGNAQSTMKMRMMELKPSEGDALYPIFDNYKNMVGFGRGYSIAVAGKKEERLDLYTEEKIFKFAKRDGVMVEYTNAEINVLGKIPVVYYSQKRTEWEDVQWLIERLEDLLSNFADTNDYFGSPSYMVKGGVVQFASKGEQGKVFEVEGKDGDMKLLTWDQAPESIKLEINTLIDLIYTITQTADISFKEMKGLGALSGIAIKLMFMDAHSRARKKQGGAFGECIQRRINLIKAGMAKVNTAMEEAVDMSITPKFGVYMPDNEVEQVETEGKVINNLLTATGGKPVLTQKTAVENAPMVEDAKKELATLQAEKTEEQVVLEM